ncbi:hypothetical protein N7494_009511 [Penicillium frequentans]|uniref:Uncharacterized protein n=1 Tax=Penicillium frequentans TaxID=3151616 RepID=A0AAD6CQ60_9EURO|nr:hypothetical protein N7494_009511 [Penicillium glabrum]
MAAQMDADTMTASSKIVNIDKVTRNARRAFMDLRLELTYTILQQRICFTHQALFAMLKTACSDGGGAK